MAAIAINPGRVAAGCGAMRRQVLTHDVDRWARSFLQALGAEPGE